MLAVLLAAEPIEGATPGSALIAAAVILLVIVGGIIVHTRLATLPDPVIAGLRTAAWAFVGSFAPALLGWLNSVYQWANDSTGTVLYPDATLLAKGLVAATIAAGAGLVSLSVNAWQTQRGAGAHYPTPRPPGR